MLTFAEGPEVVDASDKGVWNVELEREGVDVPGQGVADGVGQLRDARLLAVLGVHQSRPELAQQGPGKQYNGPMVFLREVAAPLATLIPG